MQQIPLRRIGAPRSVPAAAAAGMRVTEVRPRSELIGEASSEAGSSDRCRPENYSFDDVGNVLGYENNCMNGSRYRTEQTYTYDALYQLISASGTTEDNPYAIPGSPDYSSTYTQDFSFDAVGNMTYKKSTETITPAIQKKGGDDLNYEFTYQYDADYAHRLTRVGSEQKGWRYYTYDANGNVTSESDGVAPNEDTTTLTPVTVTTQTNEEGDSGYEADYAWAWPWSGNTGGNKPTSNNKRTYEWNSRNLLMRSVVPDYDTRYAYAADGNRAAKWTSTKSSETLYFNTMWTWHTDTGLPEGQYSKHIYLGETRVVTKQTSKLEASYGQSDEWHHRYYYHPDHLGSAQLVTDYEGNEYQRIEYTPYGELWVEKKTAKEEGLRYLPYKFTAKEMDEDTGLYYYGARYLDSKYSRWLSTDPAVSDYIPQTGGDNARLPNGGMYNYTNLSLYHYSNNNPIKYTDPDGNSPLWFGLGKSGFGHEAPQRVFGFKDSMDDKSWCFGFDLHATAFKTDNFTLRLWKGNYGDATSLLYPTILGGAGGEIGLYNPDGSSMSKSDLAALGIVGSEISIKNKITGKTIASHKEKSASFWTTVFSWFNKSRKEELSTKNTLIFDTDEHAADFESKIKNKKTSDDAKAYPHNKNESIEIYRAGNRVIINYGDE